jgi:hypothetical protein
MLARRPAHETQPSYTQLSYKFDPVVARPHSKDIFRTVTPRSTHASNKCADRQHRVGTIAHRNIRSPIRSYGLHHPADPDRRLLFHVCLLFSIAHGQT